MTFIKHSANPPWIPPGRKEGKEESDDEAPTGSDNRGR